MNTNNKKSRIHALLTKFSQHKATPPANPFLPKPGQRLSDPFSGINAEFTETEADVKQIFGMPITFGTKQALQVDENGNSSDIKQAPSYRIGTNKIINRIEDIAGVCPFCESLAMQRFQAGEITNEEAHLLSMFDTMSAAQCGLCGRNTCSVHCRPVEIGENVQNICINCLQEIESKNRRKKIIRFLLSPLLK